MKYIITFLLLLSTVVNLNCGCMCSCCGYSQEQFILEAFGLEKGNIVYKDKYEVKVSLNSDVEKNLMKAEEEKNKLNEVIAKNQDKVKYIITYSKNDSKNILVEVYLISVKPTINLNKLVKIDKPIVDSNGKFEFFFVVDINVTEKCLYKKR